MSFRCSLLFILSSDELVIVIVKAYELSRRIEALRLHAEPVWPSCSS